MKFYDPDRWSLVIAGIPVLGGYGEDTYIKVEQTTPGFTSTVGVGGEVTRNAMKDGRTKVTLTLLRTADANALLSALHNLDINTPGGAGVGPTSIKNLDGTESFLAWKSWIVAPPDFTLAKEVDSFDWVIECADTVRFDG